MEFACIHCGRKLRTPDGSSGKRAKCPGCQQIVQIPPVGDDGSELGDVGAGAATSPPTPASTPRSAAREREASAAASNPYAAPKSAETWTGVPGGSLGVTGELAFGNVASQAWRLLRERPLDAILLSLVLLGLNVGLVVVATVLQGMAEGSESARALISLLTMVLQAVVSAVVMLPLINFATNRISGQPGLQNLFRRSDRIPRLMGITLGVALVVFGGTFLMALIVGLLVVLGRGTMGASVPAALIGLLYLAFIIGIYAIMLSFLVAPWLVVNRDHRVVESMRLSARYMKGKRFRSFGILFMTSLLGMLAAMLTLGLAMLVLPAFFALVWGLMCALIVNDSPAESAA
ncbi:MAG: hypothetical protein U0795_26755 [Pirellulales bacterium]